MLKKYPAGEQGPLGPGERLHDLRFLGSGGGAVSLYDDRLFGWPKVLHVAPTPEAAMAGCARLAALSDEFHRAETQVFGITGAAPPENAALAARLGLCFPLLCDPDGALVRALGAGAANGPCTLVFDSILRLEHNIAGQTPEKQIETALELVRARAAAQSPTVVTAQAPVLIVPRVLDPDHCRRLMDFWERGDKIQGAVASEADRGNTVKLETKVRTDVAVPDDSAECRELADVIARRLLPEVLKAFCYRVTRIETFRIGCYDAADGGHFAAHRDNTSSLTEYRRFAMSLNLNSGDYEGGQLRLPEFGPQLYAPGPGGAAVFSCSLLHFVMPVTKGRRFALFGFLYAEQEEAIRQRNNARR